MAEVILKNKGSFDAVYGDDEHIDFITNEVSTIVVQGITAVKTVDKEYWVNGPLTYTIVVTNDSGSTLSELVLNDDLDILVAFDANFGVLIDGAPTVYTYFSNILTVPLPELATGESVTITFRVLQE